MPSVQTDEQRQALRFALRPRNPQPLAGLGFFIIGSAALWIAVMWAQAIESPPTDRGYTAAYINAYQAGSMAAAVWACIVASLASLWFGKSVRRFFGLPTRESWRPRLRIFLASLVTIWLIARRLNVDFSRFENPGISADVSLVGGLLVWLLLSFDAWLMLYDGVRYLRVRIAEIAARTCTLKTLPNAGWVKVSGTVVRSEGPGEVIYDNLNASARTMRAEPFMLREGGHQAHVEIDPARVILMAQPAPDGTIRVADGDKVVVVAKLESSGDSPFRDGLPRLCAGEGRAVRLHAGNPSWNRKLLAAATVELLAASAYIAGAVLLVVYRLGQ